MYTSDVTHTHACPASPVLLVIPNSSPTLNERLRYFTLDFEENKLEEESQVGVKKHHTLGPMAGSRVGT